MRWSGILSMSKKREPVARLDSDPAAFIFVSIC